VLAKCRSGPWPHCSIGVFLRTHIGRTHIVDSEAGQHVGALSEGVEVRGSAHPRLDHVLHEPARPITDHELLEDDVSAHAVIS